MQNASNDSAPTALSAKATHRMAALYLGFLLTGAATALLGTALPVILQRWQLNDGSGGSLLLLAWGGSTCGALLCRGNLRRSAAGGLLITAASMLALAAVDRGAALPLFAFYGIGLGITMTAITLMCSGQNSEAARRGVLMRLNLLWSIGACVSPTLATHALTFSRVGGLFASMGLVFCVSAIAVAFSGEAFNGTATVNTTDEIAALRPAPPALFAMVLLAVGVESAGGGWLTTYAGRTAHTELIAISATSAFWVGLLLSRALHSVSGLRWLHGRSVLIAHAAMAALATATLFAAPHAAVFLPSTLLAGFGLGPLYPRVLAMVVGQYRARAIFIVAGVGSAAVPWLTGAVSHATGSLRLGLAVPCVGAAALVILFALPAKAQPAAATP